MNSNINAVFHYIIAATLLLIGCMSLGVNIFVLSIYTKVFPTKRLRLLNLHLISLAISNIGIVFLFPLKLDACFNHEWRLGEKICHLSGFLDGVFAYSQIFTLTMVAIEKYLIIRNLSQSIPRYDFTVYKIIFCWFLSIVLSSQPYFGFGGSFVLHKLRISCGFNYEDPSTINAIYFFTCAILGFVIPLIIISISYIGIFKIVKRSSRNVIGTMSISSCRIAKQRDLEVKLAKSAAISIIYFTVSWLPYAVIAGIGVLGYKTSIVSSLISLLLSKCSSLAYMSSYIYHRPDFKVYIFSKNLNQNGITVIELNKSNIGGNI